MKLENEKIILLKEIFDENNISTLEDYYDLIMNEINNIIKIKQEIKELNLSLKESLDFLVSERLKITNKQLQKKIKKIIKKLANDKINKNNVDEDYIKFKKIFLD